MAWIKKNKEAEKVYNNVKCHNKGDKDIYNIQDN